MQSFYNIKGPYSLIVSLLVFCLCFLPHYSDFESVMQFHYSPIMHAFPGIAGLINVMHPTFKLIIAASFLSIIAQQIRILTGFFLEELNFNNIEHIYIIGIASLFLPTQLLSAELFALPIIISVLIKSLSIEKDQNNIRAMFDAGVLTAFASMLFFPSIIFILIPIMSAGVKRVGSGKLLTTTLTGLGSMLFVLLAAALLLNKLPDVGTTFERLSNNFLFFPQIQFIPVVEIILAVLLCVLTAAGSFVTFNTENVLRVSHNKICIILFGICTIPILLFGPELFKASMVVIPLFCVMIGQFTRYFRPLWRNIVFFGFFSLILLSNYYKFLIG